AHPSKCDMYITCSNGIAHEMPCPAGLNWNDVTKECDWPRDAPCCKAIARTCHPKVNLSTICKNRADGNYPHPDFCKMYIACSNGIAYEMPCPAGLNWNDEKKYCDWPFNAPCE
ncbi:predicted protein, partial [Nematostella vectensis]